MDGLRAVVEQTQADGTIVHICFLSRSTFPNERNSNATGLQCAAVVWAAKENRQILNAMTFVVVSDHQPLKNLESQALKVNRVQRWFDFLNAYSYKLVCRPGRLHRHANLMPPLPFPATDAAIDAHLRLTDPTDDDVYFAGTGGLQPRTGKRTGSVLGGLHRRPRKVCKGGGRT